MSLIAALICQTLFALKSTGGIEPQHAENSIYVEGLMAGLNAEGTIAKLPRPLLDDDMSKEEQRAVVLKLAESTKALEDFVKPGVSAPYKIKLHDWPGATGTIRGFDVWFVVHGKLDEINTDEIGGPSKNAANREAGGMQFEGRMLDDAELKQLGLKPSGKSDRFGHIECSLLKEVEVTMTNRSLATRSNRSLVIATGTVHNLPTNAKERNAWRAIDSRPGKKSVGPWQPYSGGISYTKVTRLDFGPDAPLFVEIHAAFVEPKGWFGGRPILKSKITVAANDQIRELRREIAKKREK
jgi:hypothetical protein